MKFNGDVHEIKCLDAMDFWIERVSVFTSVDGLNVVLNNALMPSILNECDDDHAVSLDENVVDAIMALQSLQQVSRFGIDFIDIPISHKKVLPSVLQAPELELKPLPSHLKYAFLGSNDTLLVIIAKNLTAVQEERLLRVLKEHKTAIGWTLADIKGISPTMCMHRILLEDDSKPSREMQRRLNPPMMEVVKAKIIKLLDAGVIYPISDSKWVSPIHVVPKKAGITVKNNKENELVPVRI